MKTRLQENDYEVNIIQKKEKDKKKDDLTEFYKKLKNYDYNKTICLDKTSIYLNMTQAYGRSRSGTRVIKKTNKYPYKS
jgi:hypothetical protein